MAILSRIPDRESGAFDVHIDWGDATTDVEPRGRYTLVGKDKKILHGNILDLEDPHGQDCLKEMRQRRILPLIVK